MLLKVCVCVCVLCVWEILFAYSILFTIYIINPRHVIDFNCSRLNLLRFQDVNIGWSNNY